MPARGDIVGSHTHLLSLRHLERFSGGPRGEMTEFLYPYATADVVHTFDDFNGDTIVTDFWTTNAGTGATAFAIPSTPLLGGAISGATGTNGTASNRVVNLYGPPIYKGDNNVGMEIRFKIDAVTYIEFAAGFIDTHSTITTPVVLIQDIDTPSFASGVGDAALVGIDTAETLTTLALCGVGSGGLVSAWKEDIGTVTPTAATYGRIRLQLSGNNVMARYWEGNAPGTIVTKTTGIEGGTLIRPIIAISGPSTSSRTYDIDYWRIWQDR